MANRAAYWQQMVTEWEASGLSQAEFCRRRELKAVTFGGWKQRLVGSTARSDGQNLRNRASQKVGVASSKQGADDRTPSFVEVALSGEMAAGRSSKVSGLGGAQRSGYEVTFPCGTSVRLPADFDVDKVSQLIQVARSC